MADRREELRAADSDRQFVAERLRGALNEGRLNLSEYDERLQQTYAAKTYGELDRVLGDLPADAGAQDGRVAPAGSGAPVPPTQAGGPHGRGALPPWLLAIWGSWLTTTLILFVIYAATDLGGYPWPIWVAGPWGVLLLLRTISGLASGDPAVEYQRRQGRRYRERARRQERWQRRQDRYR